MLFPLLNPNKRIHSDAVCCMPIPFNQITCHFTMSECINRHQTQCSPTLRICNSIAQGINSVQYQVLVSITELPINVRSSWRGRVCVFSYQDSLIRASWLTSTITTPKARNAPNIAKRTTGASFRGCTAPSRNAKTIDSISPSPRCTKGQ
jgi:hypothetical protein